MMKALVFVSAIFLVAAVSGRQLLQSGNSFPAGIVLGPNATCIDEGDDGTLRFVNSTVQICLTGRGWRPVNEVGATVEGLESSVTSLQSRVDELELLGAECAAASNSTGGCGNDTDCFGSMTTLCEMRSLQARMHRLKLREMCALHGTFNENTNLCDCDCTSSQGCWEEETDCTACADGYSGPRCRSGTDECNGNPCHADATCTDQFIGYSCECHVGFAGDGHECEDVNECSTFPGICEETATCVNTYGSYECVCLDGQYMGEDGNCYDGCGTTSTEPARSCLWIKYHCPQNVTGVYWLNFFGATDAQQAYCDMDTDMGGWTLVMSSQRTTESYPTADARGSLNLSDNLFDPTPGHKKYSDAAINAIFARNPDHSMLIKSQGNTALGATSAVWDSVFRFVTAKTWTTESGQEDGDGSVLIDGAIMGADTYHQYYVVIPPSSHNGYEVNNVGITHANVGVHFRWAYLSKDPDTSAGWVLSDACLDGYTGPYVRSLVWNCYANHMKVFVQEGQNECVLGTHNCDAVGGVCTDDYDGFHCECADGFTGNGTHCEDIDECVSVDCGDPLRTCVNTPGSYSCPCIETYTDVNGECVYRCGDTSESAGPSCLWIRDHCSGNNTLDDGAYWITFYDTSPAAEVYCDMTTDNGGWMLAMSARRSTDPYPTAASTGTMDLSDNHFSTATGYAKYSDAQINEIFSRNSDHWMMIKSRQATSMSDTTITWDTIFRFSTAKAWDTEAGPGEDVDTIFGADTTNQLYVLPSNPVYSGTNVDNTGTTHVNVGAKYRFMYLSTASLNAGWAISDACDDGHTGPYVRNTAWNCYNNHVKFFVKESP